MKLELKLKYNMKLKLGIKIQHEIEFGIENTFKNLKLIEVISRHVVATNAR